VSLNILKTFVDTQRDFLMFLNLKMQIGREYRQRASRLEIKQQKQKQKPTVFTVLFSN